MINEDFEITILSSEELGQEAEQKELTLDELLALPHPFEQNPELLDLVENFFPGKNYREQLLAATQPGISDNPDELEKWEAEVILRRKQKLPNDFAIAHLIRILYEETFSVRQFQGKQSGSEGMTLGGLLSHHYFRHKVDGVDLNTVLDLEITENTFKDEFERLVKNNDFKSLEKLVILVTETAFTERYFTQGHAHRMRTNLLRRRMYIHSEMAENMGFRAIKVIHSNPTLLQKVTDKKLLEIPRVDFETNLVYLLHRLWGILGNSPGVFFSEGGYYKYEATEELLTGLERLILFRINTQTQILYKYLSPSGYINNQKKTD